MKDPFTIGQHFVVNKKTTPCTAKKNEPCPACAAGVPVKLAGVSATIKVNGQILPLKNFNFGEPALPAVIVDPPWQGSTIEFIPGKAVATGTFTSILPEGTFEKLEEFFGLVRRNPIYTWLRRKPKDW